MRRESDPAVMLGMVTLVVICVFVVGVVLSVLFWT